MTGARGAPFVRPRSALPRRAQRYAMISGRSAHAPLISGHDPVRHVCTEGLCVRDRRVSTPELISWLNTQRSLSRSGMFPSPPSRRRITTRSPRKLGVRDSTDRALHNPAQLSQWANYLRGRARFHQVTTWFDFWDRGRRLCSSLWTLRVRNTTLTADGALLMRITRCR
jgi:hypothetical protein